MLNFVLIVAVAYLLYKWGARLQVRAHIFGELWLRLGSYVCSMAAGTSAALYVTLTAMEQWTVTAGILEVSFVSTVLSVLFGEYLYSRTRRLCLQALAPLSSEKHKQ